MKVLVAGDYCLNHRSQKMGLEELNEALSMVKSANAQMDYSIVNLECSVSDHIGSPIKKVGRNLFNDSKALQNLRDSGFKCLALANNHFADYGESTVADSLKLIDAFGFDKVGAGLDLDDANRTLYVHIKGKKLAIINCCEHEFTIAGKQSAGCNPLNLINQHKAIKKARECADYVLMFIHGGSENFPLPTPRMQQSYRFFIEIGADVVVNCHQHCYSGYESYRGKLIFYGLGNFFFDWAGMRNKPWNEGFMLQLSFSDTITFDLLPYIQCNEKAEIRKLSLDERLVFDNKINRLNKIIVDENFLKESFSQWVDERSRDYQWFFRMPVPRIRRCFDRIISKFRRKKNVGEGTFLTSEKVPTLLSYSRCESHHEIFVELLSNRMKGV